MIYIYKYVDDGASIYIDKKVCVDMKNCVKIYGLFCVFCLFCFLSFQIR